MHYKNLLKHYFNLKENEILSCRSEANGALSVTVKPSRTLCPHCAQPHLLSKGTYIRTVKVNIHATNVVTVHFRLKRFKCPVCFKTCIDNQHIAPRKSTLSWSVIMQIMDLLKSPSESFTSVAEKMIISSTTVARIFDTYYSPKPRPLPIFLSIDEVYTKTLSNKNKFACVLYDPVFRRVHDFLPSRHKSYLFKYFNDISISERDNVKFISIDLYETYRMIQKVFFKKAVLCVDSFHVVRLIATSLDNIRLRLLSQYDTQSNQYYLLKTWKKLLFDAKVDLQNKGKYNRKLKQHVNYAQLLELMFKNNPELETAYELYHAYLAFNKTFEPLEMKKLALTDLITEFESSNMEEFLSVASTLRNWFDEIVNSFTIYEGKRISNAFAERTNGKIKQILANSKGLNNFDRFKRRVMYVVDPDSSI